MRIVLLSNVKKVMAYFLARHENINLIITAHSPFNTRFGPIIRRNSSYIVIWHSLSDQYSINYLGRCHSPSNPTFLYQALMSTLETTCPKIDPPKAILIDQSTKSPCPLSLRVRANILNQNEQIYFIEGN